MALPKINGSGAPPETKVVSTAGMGTFVGIVLQLLANYFPHLTLPSPATATLIATGLGGIVGYLAPHTARIGDVVEAVQKAVAAATQSTAPVVVTPPAPAVTVTPSA
jgi:hypothetical protein